MKKIFQKTIQENVLNANRDYKKDLRYFYNLRVKQFIKNKSNAENRWYKNYKQKITEIRLQEEKNRRDELEKISTKNKNEKYIALAP